KKVLSPMHVAVFESELAALCAPQAELGQRPPRDLRLTAYLSRAPSLSLALVAFPSSSCSNTLANTFEPLPVVVRVVGPFPLLFWCGSTRADRTTHRCTLVRVSLVRDHISWISSNVSAFHVVSDGPLAYP